MEVVHHLMCSVGVLGVHNLPPVAVELPDQRGIGDKGLHCGQLLGLVGAPVATGSCDGKSTGGSWHRLHYEARALTENGLGMRLEVITL